MKHSNAEPLERLDAGHFHQRRRQPLQRDRDRSRAGFPALLPPAADTHAMKNPGKSMNKRVASLGVDATLALAITAARATTAIAQTAITTTNAPPAQLIITLEPEVDPDALKGLSHSSAPEQTRLTSLANPKHQKLLW